MFNFQKRMFVVFGILVVMLLDSMAGNAHAQSWGQADIPSSQGRMAMNVMTGRVLDVQATDIEVVATNQNRAFGGLIGGLLGAAAARNGSWQGQAAVGSIGAFLGEKIANNSGTEMRPAMQVIVRLDSGQVIAVVQEMNGIPVGAGDAVFVVGSYPAVRVLRANPMASMNASPQPSFYQP
ncbi:outer membrane lipoprotein (plasmid) [Rhodoferax ferrireducens T118]|uniref:Outer membrane lipoprotein n=1 Tax=Albidiferax ferrireducens (strain ATCC BAA-621 / DSM 15236 / T118) TaxID=338969 RepID=Q21QI6_ALBFT|nr:hypothetical protein [Rhodoferax ferrireducens]ABD71959.1 outer membrane lipoprotein [Rhodoferax ferrireducens T118]